LWEVKFLTRPKCYFPGDKFINTRCTGVNPGIPGSVGSFEHRIRGFVLHQGTEQETSSTATLAFVDREDLAIQTWIEEWKNLINDRETRTGARKEDYVCDIQITYYNTLKVPIKKITLFNCLLQDGTPNEDGTNDPSSSSDISMSLKYEHYKREHKNR
jgi:hypothetical protein